MILLCLIFMSFVAQQTHQLMDGRQFSAGLYTTTLPWKSYNNVTIGVILPETLMVNKTNYEKDSVYVFDLGYIKLIEDIVRDSLEDRNLLLKKNIVFIYKRSTCTNFASFSAFEIQKKINVFIGLACSRSSSIVTQFSRVSWRKPVLSLGSSTHEFRDQRNIIDAVRLMETMENIKIQVKDFKDILTRVGPISNCEQLAQSSLNLFKKVLNRNQNGRMANMEVIYTADNVANDAICRYYAIAMAHKTETGRLSPTVYFTKLNDISNKEVGKILDTAHKRATVVVLCADPKSIRQIMLKAYDLNFVNGEYVFFNIDLFSSNEQKQPWLVKNDSDANNKKARKAYEVLMTVTLLKPNSEAYRNFSQLVKKRAKATYDYDYPGEEVNSFVGAFHDAVLLYALALNDTLTLNPKGIDNGTEITRNMWNRTFIGITGNVSIDANGDRNADYSLLDMDENGNFQVVANYYGNNQRYVPVEGVTIRWGNEENLPPPDTPKCGFDKQGCPNSKLSVMEISFTVMGSLLVVCLIMAAFVYRRIQLQAELHLMSWRVKWEEIETTESRKVRRQSRSSNAILPNHDSVIALNSNSRDKDSAHVDMNATTDCVNSKENSLITKKQLPSWSKTRKRKKSNLQMYFLKKNKNYNHSELGTADEQISLNTYTKSGPCDDDSIESVTTVAGVQLDGLAQLFSQTAFYKSQTVAIKPIQLHKKFDCTSTAFLVEMKKIRDLSCDHLVRFVGACIDAPNECIISEYCPKGSLQDVLENDNVNLDWMFKYSLLQDICRGMIYLHNNFGPHGNLKSSNCLVDARFSLKIADFGMHLFRGAANNRQPESEEEEYRWYKSKQWTAPELLREANPSSEGTTKADCYSFAIIAQEIVYRRGVFWVADDVFLEPQQIVERVRQGSLNGQAPFRPALPKEEGLNEDLVKIIQRCWHEEPSWRQDFDRVKASLRKLNREGDSSNILDNLLRRMEQYSNNLEGLVALRTGQYEEEKKKAENLLYCMLPKSVAGTLMRGESVSAEWFDSVTIYFSDICGFTALSSESTPMQIVDLLNDLYTLFDGIIGNYDAYKVETIGDAYMVVSGLPHANGILHAREVSRMSLAFLRNIFSFRVRHRPDYRMKLRIGQHSGAVCAGVVGLKMPRFCLFGDTVNTASRMESNGEPLKIHISQSTKSLLDMFGSFVISERGVVEMKGKGKQTTYWLHGENDDIVDPVPIGAKLCRSGVVPSQAEQRSNCSNNFQTNNHVTNNIERQPSIAAATATATAAALKSAPVNSNCADSSNFPLTQQQLQLPVL